MLNIIMHHSVSMYTENSFTWDHDSGHHDEKGRLIIPVCCHYYHLL